MPACWPQPEHMRWRDALKSAAQADREGIGADETKYRDASHIVKDGGDGQKINTYMRDTRERLVRVEDRLMIQTKLLFLMLGSIVFATFVGLLLAFVLG